MHVVISKSLSKINHYLTTGHNNMIKYNYTNLGQSWMDDDDIEEWNDSNPWDPYESWESPNDLVFDDSGNSITRHQHKTKNYNSDVWGKNHNCKWSSWSAVGGCSTACGKGVQSYTRKNCRSKKREKTETCVGWKNCRGTFYN